MFRTNNVFSTLGEVYRTWIYSGAVLAVSVTDAVWSYETAAHRHSVIEIALGAGLCLSVHFAFQGIKRAFSYTLPLLMR